MFERIQIDPSRCGGSPVIKGTRIPVAVILDHLAAGKGWDDVLAGFPQLTLDDIRAALELAGTNKQNFATDS